MLENINKNWLQLFDSEQARKADRLAFLPAALEIQDSPPSPIGRAIIWSILFLFGIAVTWSIFGKIDIVAVATGKVIPSDRIKTIQPFDRGTVVEIHIREGDVVNKGDPLVTLDSTQTEADVLRLKKELHSFQSEWLRAKAFSDALAYIDQPSGSDQPVIDPLVVIQQAISKLNIEMDKLEITFQTSLLQAQLSEYLSRHDALEGQLRAREGELRQALSIKHKIERTLPLVNERANSIKNLYEKKLISRDEHLALEQERISQEQNFLAESGRVDALNGEIKAVKDQILTLESEYKRNNLIALMEARLKAQSLEQEWIKARQRNSQQLISAPISGTIQQLAIHTIGGVVTPAQELMVIVPEDSHLEVEAFIQNKDIGFVAEGQNSEVKIDTFNFTKYGTIDAELTTISHDSVNDDKLGLIYPARVSLANSKIQIADRWVNLSPGMSVTVEIKTGKRRIIEFFLSPLLRYKQESIRER